MKMLYPFFLLAAGSFLLQAYGTKVDDEGLVLEHFTIATPTINPTLSLALKSEVCMQIYFCLWFSLLRTLHIAFHRMAE